MMIADFVNGIPNILLFIIISSVIIAVSLILLVIIRRYHYLTLEECYVENEAIVGVCATIAVIYAVVIGVTALYIFNNFDKADNIVLHEANITRDIYRDSRWLIEPTRTEVETSIRQYVTTVVVKDWPQMVAGQELSRDGDILIEKLTSDLRNYPVDKSKQWDIAHDMLNEVNALYDTREDRILVSQSALGVDIWVVVIVSSMLTIAVNFFFGMELKLHAIMIIFVSLMVATMLFILVALDWPFRGNYSIKPTAFQAVLTKMDGK